MTFDSRICRLRNALESLARGSQKFAPELTYKTVRYPISTLNAPYCRYNSLPLVIPAKKPAKKPAKQALKLTLVTLTLLAAPLAGSTRSISNACAYLRTASVAPKAPKAPTVNKRRKPSAPPLGPPKSSQRAKPIKVTRITRIEPPIDYS